MCGGRTGASDSTNEGLDFDYVGLVVLLISGFPYAGPYLGAILDKPGRLDRIVKVLPDRCSDLWDWEAVWGGGGDLKADWKRKSMVSDARGGGSRGVGGRVWGERRRGSSLGEWGGLDCCRHSALGERVRRLGGCARAWHSLVGGPERLGGSRGWMFVVQGASALCDGGFCVYGLLLSTRRHCRL